MLACEIHHLGYLGLCDFIGKNPTFADTMMMNMKHDTGRFFPVLLEKALHYMDDKLHGSVVIIQQQHTIEVRPFGNRFGSGSNNSSGVTTVIVLI